MTEQVDYKELEQSDVIKHKKRKVIIIDDNSSSLPIINKGTGAGGANTNYFGKRFETITNNEPRLIEEGYVKTILSKNIFDYYLSKTYEDKTINFVLQNGLKAFMVHKYNYKKEDIYKCPDEAYIIEYNDGRKKIKVLEKKSQNVEGSVEEKLTSKTKRIYELMLGEQFKVDYGFCVNYFLQKKMLSSKTKYKHYNIMLSEDKTVLLFGNNSDYFETLNSWINE